MADFWQDIAVHIRSAQGREFVIEQQRSVGARTRQTSSRGHQ